MFKTRVALASEWKLPDGNRVGLDRLRALGMADDQPILLDEHFRPSGLVAEYIRYRNVDLDPKTSSQYAYELCRLESFLNSRAMSWVDASSEDLRAYRRLRTIDDDPPIAPATWRRNSAAIRGFFSWMQDADHRATNPTVGQFGKSIISGKPVPDLRVRALSREQYALFVTHGIKGYPTEEVVSPARQGQHVGRLHLGAALALATGMRLEEFSTLLLSEVQQSDGSGAQDVELQACAKYERPRSVRLTRDVLRQIELYRRSERAYLAPRPRKRYEASYQDHVVIENITNGIATIRQGIVESKIEVKAASPLMRKRMIFDGPNGLESASLFLSRSGERLGQRSWMRCFAEASDRARTARLQNGRLAFPHRVTAHDFRHTFAVELLRKLMRDLRQRDLHFSTNPQDHLVLNPVLAVQQRLGHRSPSTTLTYLRYIESLDEQLEDTWAGWEDPAFSFEQYGDLILRQQEAPQ